VAKAGLITGLAALLALVGAMVVANPAVDLPPPVGVAAFALLAIASPLAGMVGLGLTAAALVGNREGRRGATVGAVVANALVLGLVALGWALSPSWCC
jgi:hypothetical protein